VHVIYNEAVSALQIEGMAAVWRVPCDHELRLPIPVSSHQYIDMTSTRTQTSVLMPSSHKSVSHHNQYRGILAMMEQLSVSQVKNTLGDHRFNANTGTDSQNIELLTANHRVCLYSFVLLQTNIFFCWQSMLILPHSFVCHASKEQLVALLQARWHEHLGEALMLVPHGRKEGLKLQKSLMEHRMKRAELEAALYAAALGLPSGSISGG